MKKSSLTSTPMGDFDCQNWPPITDPEAPRVRSDEALPLGNALLGMLIWMRGDTLLLSLDRGDLWDERRPAAEQNPRYNWHGMCEMIARGEWAELGRIFQKSQQEPFPTRLPGGRVELKFPFQKTRFSLDYRRAVAQVVHPDGARIELMVPAGETAVARWRMTGFAPAMRLLMPVFEESDDVQTALLNYPAPRRICRDSCEMIGIGNSDGTLAYAVGMGCVRGADGAAEGVAVIEPAATVDAAFAAVETAVRQALKRPFAEVRAEHEAWWQDFYAHSQVHFADRELDDAYLQTRYFFGANARARRPPIALQGIWTADDGHLPPWRGDYHNNLNTQFTYLAYLAANDIAEGREFLDFMFRLLPKHQALARSFYGVREGAVIPGAMTQGGEFMPSSVNYGYHPDNGLWVAWMFFRHWRYTHDAEFLRSEAYPYAVEVAQGALALATLDENGRYRFPWHASPELGDGKPEAYFKEMTSYVNCNLCALLDALAVMADELGKTAEAKAWRDRRTHCADPETMTAKVHYYWYEKTVLGIQTGRALPNSHRHLVHLMGLYPFDLFDFEHDPEVRKLLDDTLNHLDFLGSGQWVGFSWPWQAIMELRMGNPAKAVRFIKTFLQGFCTVNGFNVNGDFKNLGVSAYKYRPFTLETNFEAQEAMHELLLSENRGVLKFFPAAAVLGDAEFKNLRAPGAFLVSGTLRAGSIEQLEIHSEVGCELRFANAERRSWQIAVSDGDECTSDAPEIVIPTRRGTRLILH